MSSLLLEGKTALITGAASGIGAAAALVFAVHGAKVALADINEQGGMETTTAIKKNGGAALFVRADVTSASDVAAMVRAVVDNFGRLDCAFNNAGVDGEWQQLHEVTDHNWNQVLEANLNGVRICLSHEIQMMLDQGGGSIVNTASVAGLVGIPMPMSPYVAA